ncbi:MAG: nucleotidyltransferase family protein [Clostridiales bacterium]|nr:nucleotidyltransferase family protein [Clostridiales bacterium]
MEIVGIVAEFDPFHRGHAWLLRQVREAFPGCTVAVAMSGSFTQRGSAAALAKQDRAELALTGGADLVLLLPVTFACASAERFARGGVALLRRVGITVLAFGSECGDLPRLQRAADALETEDYRQKLKAELAEGVSFAAARERAVAQLIGDGAEVLRQPNDLLAVEYLRALRGTGIRPFPVRRQGAAHGSDALDGAVASASALRGLLYQGRFREAAEKMPAEAGELLLSFAQAGRLPADQRRCDRTILAALRQATPEDFARLPDVSEGLEHRLYRAAQEAASPEDFCARAKTKRYAYARLRRILLCCWLGVTREDCPDEPPFLQVLAMDEQGQTLLRPLRGRDGPPLIVRPAAGKKLTGPAGEQFRLESRADDLWGLCLPEPLRGGWSYLEGMRRR